MNPPRSTPKTLQEFLYDLARAREDKERAKELEADLKREFDEHHGLDMNRD